MPQPRARTNLAAAWLAGLVVAGAVGQAPFRATVQRVEAFDLVRLEDQRVVRLQGVSLPAPAVRPADAEAALVRFLRDRLEHRPVWLSAESAGIPGDPVDHCAVLRTDAAAASINAQALAAGLAVLACCTPAVREFADLRAAAAQAQRQRAGWFGRRINRPEVPPFLNGAVLGLHSEDPDYDYAARLDELAAAGFRHVSLLISTFVADVEASDIDRTHRRCVRDQHLLATIAHAKMLGMTVMLLPVVLLVDSGNNEWRGTLRPRDAGAFWLAYDQMICHYADLAEASGADLLSVGSELCSLEGNTQAWARVIANVRGRFRGWLTYSANWDHVHVPRFFGQLDFVGMTGYFSLTKERDPQPEQLVAAWRDLANKLTRAVGMVGKPLLLTELGYASQDGINRDPWNYTMNPDRIDLQEQAQCLAAFLAVAADIECLGGAYFYDFFDDGGPNDPGYSPRGKPAFEQWQQWAAWRAGK